MYVVLVLNDHFNALAIGRHCEAVAYFTNAFLGKCFVAGEDCEGVDVVVGRVEGRGTFVAQAAWRRQILNEICNHKVKMIIYVACVDIKMELMSIVTTVSTFLLAINSCLIT